MIPIQMSYPFIANLSGLSQSLMLNCASILINVLSVSSKVKPNPFPLSPLCVYGLHIKKGQAMIKYFLRAYDPFRCLP